MRPSFDLLALSVFAQLITLTPLSFAATATAPASVKTAAPASVLPFMDDDFAAARNSAQAKNQLLVVDAWAPWCHTCLSMRNLVFTDARLKPLASRFVYLAVDTELPKNADFVARFPISSWPTLLVLDTRTGESTDKVVARFTGSMTAPELSARLDEVLRSAGGSPLADADAVAAAGNYAAAAVLYAKHASTPELRSRARLGQIQALRGLGQHLACAELGETAHAEVGRSSTAGDFFSYAVDCLEHVTDADSQLRLRKKMQQYLIDLARDANAPLLPDDRSDVYGTLVQLFDGLSDTASGDRFTEERLQLLTAAAAQAKSPTEAATYDAHRFECYRRLKRYKPAEDMLLSSEKLFPDDYNPPARLSRLYFEMGRLDEAQGRIDRALKLAQGPRRIGMYELRANIQHGLGQTKPAIASLEEAIRIAQPQSKTAASLRNKIDAMRKHIEALQSTLVPMTAPPAYEPLGPGRRGKAPKVARRDP